MKHLSPFSPRQAVFCKASGFTLLELLISMVIFSSMTLMAYSGLHSVLTSNEVTQEHEEALKGLQRTMMFLEKDIRQLAARPRHSDYGESLPALQTEELELTAVLEFTRYGNPNPAGKMRSTLQRVRYVFEKGVLQRWSWALVDHLDSKPIVMPLLNDLEQISFRFLAAKNQWKTEWVVKNKADLPKAVEIKIQHKRWGNIERLITVY
ncbi:MAG: type II secretion system minor pseudopilin GspJ [Cocleimonas sp.]|nr:type II secretion system minor pseudopilin GspJ [Cocleimonas sp.]